MKNSEDFGKEEWERTSYIAGILQGVRKYEPIFLVRNIANKMLNSFILFLLKENIFKLAPQHGIDEYGIPFDSCYGDEPVCFAPMDGKIILFRYLPIVDDIKDSLVRKKEKKIEMTFNFLLKFR